MTGKNADINYAKNLLSRAIEQETNGDYDRSLTLYEEGIQHLIHSLKGMPSTSEDYKSMKNRITEFLNRAEEVKRLVSEQKNKAKFHEHIIIKDNDLGFSYKTVFTKYLDDKVKEVIICDPYIRFHHQIQNLVRFVELCLSCSSNLSVIKLTTSKDPERYIQQEEGLIELKTYLKDKKNIEFIYDYSSTLHDRSVELNNGYVFKLGRGLDYFKSPPGKYTPGVFDMDLRPCQETTIDIFWKIPS